LFCGIAQTFSLFNLHIYNLSCDFSFLNKFPRGYALCNSNLEGKYKELIYTQGRTVGHLAPRILLFQLHQNCCHVLVEKHGTREGIYWRSRGTKASRSLSKKWTIKDTTVQKMPPSLSPFLCKGTKLYPVPSLFLWHPHHFKDSKIKQLHIMPRRKIQISLMSNLK